ncbi:MAG TPA: NADH-quinone oxidoreductase subunit L, partial [Verrucomicrobiota bacterium]|nr:NADH-quinone oxidoreductase subunit L [Verrucomicrobiota bacterium]
WSKDEILHAAHGWPASHIPFYLGMIGAFLTAFYMTRQVAAVFFGSYRGGTHHGEKARESEAHGGHAPHESPAVMTWPLIVLAVCAIGLSVIGTPWWPWFQEFLGKHHEAGEGGGVVGLMLFSSVIVFLGLGVGWWLYGRRPWQRADEPDALEVARGDIFSLLRNKYYIDEIYELTVIRFNAWWARVCDLLDRWLWGGVVQLVSYAVVGLSWVNRMFDEYVVNLGFDQGCKRLTLGGKMFSRLQSGQAQTYLRIIGAGLVVLVILLIRGSRGG